jgi:hypothetical protein
MSTRVYFNFEDGPEGTIQMGVVWEGGFDKNRPLHVFCLNVQQLLEERMTSKGFEVINGDEVIPSDAPSPTIN